MKLRIPWTIAPVLALVMPGLVAAQEGLAGTWQRELQNAAGPNPMIVLELRADGSYIQHGSGWMGDRGRYTVAGDTLTFTSDVDQRHTRTMAIKRLDATQLSLVSDDIFRQPEEWTRAGGNRYFATETIAGHAVPSSLSGLILATLKSEALPWRPDASPTRLDIEVQPNNTYEIDIAFFSPSAGEQMVVGFTPHEFRKRINRPTGATPRPLDLDFLDLPRIVELAYAAGQSGPLSRATLDSYAKFGTVWGIAMQQRQGIATRHPYGLAMDARTGVVIEEDVTGYSAQYNADWAAAARLWRRAFGPKSAACAANTYIDPLREGCQSANSEWECENLVNGTWNDISDSCMYP